MVRLTRTWFIFWARGAGMRCALRRVGIATIAVALTAVVAAGPAAGASKAAAKPDPNATLVYVNSNNIPGILDPQKYPGAGAGTLQFTASYDRLVQITPDLKL